MNLSLFILGGYGQFVWPAFIFTFLICFFLYLRTKKEYEKQEKRYVSEFKQLQNTKIKTVKEKATREILSGSSA